MPLVPVDVPPAPPVPPPLPPRLLEEGSQDLPREDLLDWWNRTLYAPSDDGGHHHGGEEAPDGRSTKRKRVTEVPLEQGMSPIVFGCGILGSGMYNSDSTLTGSLPARAIRLALRYGVNALDTSPYYHPSELSLGRILRTLHLSGEAPRDTYYLFSKVGRYGPLKRHFDYSPQRVRSSVLESRRRLNAGGSDVPGAKEDGWLDGVYLHDVEFVAESVGPSNSAGFHALEGLTSPSIAASMGLAPGDEAKSFGPGDEKVLEAVCELWRLKDEGVIRRVGISGYPLPTLLRLSRLIAASPPYRPLDMLLSYSHHTLSSSLLDAYLPFLRAPINTPRGIVPAPLILNASPFSMGLLVDGPPPAWHPASEELKGACVRASQALQEHGTGLSKVALGFGIGPEVDGVDWRMHHGKGEGRHRLRTLVGLSTPDQVHEAVEVFRDLYSPLPAAPTATAVADCTMPETVGPSAPTLHPLRHSVSITTNDGDSLGGGEDEKEKDGAAVGVERHEDEEDEEDEEEDVETSLTATSSTAPSTAAPSVFDDVRPTFGHWSNVDTAEVGGGVGSSVGMSSPLVTTPSLSPQHTGGSLETTSKPSSIAAQAIVATTSSLSPPHLFARIRSAAEYEASRLLLPPTMQRSTAPPIGPKGTETRREMMLRKRKEASVLEDAVRTVMRECGVLGWDWESPGPEA